MQKQQKMILVDGQSLSDYQINELSAYLLESTNQLFVKNSNWIVNFVGYAEINSNNITYQLYSFPKHFNFDKLDIKVDFQNVVTSIIKANKNVTGINNDERLITNRLLYLNNIVDYYLQFGLYQEINKIAVKGTPKKINFQKTIKKITPIVIEDNFVYNQFVNQQKTYNYTFVTDCLVYFVNEETKKYNFYFPNYQIEYEYNKQIFRDKHYVIKRLEEIYQDTFNDQVKYLIKNMLDYLKNNLLTQAQDLLLCTTNYELVWEEMVACLLGSNFQKTTFNISEANHKIVIDHFDNVNQIIFDAKYYQTNFKQKTAVDYKQLFYHYHVVHEMNDNSYKQKQMYQQWKNGLIKPIECESKVENYLNRDEYDGVNIKEYFINTNQTIEYYLYGGYNPLKELLKNN